MSGMHPFLMQHGWPQSDLTHLQRGDLEMMEFELLQDAQLDQYDASPEATARRATRAEALIAINMALLRYPDKDNVVFISTRTE